ncbi:hypothetical protein BDN70DRAFT_884993 [Pholiota conissans]|uniref:Uncharacterized protein n=1 Tax=Pholiota conissans TaxID=109636 RepID=A0A9P5YUX8_9AGAR|nr:hypothetical protein BDN70DRAFT_884993 [Pholiota conissans]
MSDSDYAAPKKRKSDGVAGSSKRARIAPSSGGQALVAAILKDANSYPIPEDDDDIRRIFVELAQYARTLENGAGSSAGVKAGKTKDQIADSAAKLRAAAVSGIKKQMGWKPSCKTGTAKWVYDGVCADAEVFGAALGFSGPPTWKMKKIPTDEFQKAIGHIQGSVRYSDLYITGNDVTVRWQPDEGTFKFSGSYGV